MNDQTPIGWLNGCLPSGKSEAEVRQQRISMLDAIAPARTRYVPKVHAGCPFCGTDAPMATRVGSRFIVACMNDDCDAVAQASGHTMEAAWAVWDRRAV